MEDEMVGCKQAHIEYSESSGRVSIGDSSVPGPKLQKSQVLEREICCPEKREAKNASVPPVYQDNDCGDKNGECEFTHVKFPGIPS